MADSEDEETPPERDVKDFSFKQMRKIRMFDTPTSLPTPRSSLLSASTKYGLMFVGCPTGIKVIKTETIERINESDEGSMQNIVAHCPSSFIEIGHSVQFVGLSSDDLTLSVCYENGNQTVMGLFDVPTLASPNTSSAKFGEITITSAGVSVGNVLWNPGFPGIFAVCLSSGSVAVMELTETEIKTLASLPGNLKANAICWSPKGKQLVVGHKDGRLTQYSQALQVKKEIECPEVFIDDPHSVTDLLWITATLFAVVYSSFEEGDTPKFQLISTPKNEPRTITNFDDIYYVMSEERQPIIFFKNIIEWSMLVSACSNGFEASVVGKYGGEATTPWEKWNFEETSRAEMPLTNNNDETFPMGMAFDFGSTRPVVEVETQLPPAPIMMLLSTDGVLCPFYMVNQTPNANHSIMKAVEPLPLGGQRKAIVSNTGPLSTGTPAFSGPKGNGSSAPGTAGNLPVGAFSFMSAKQTASPASGLFSSGLSGNIPVGALSFAGSKQPVSLSSGTPTSGTPTSLATSAFSFASPKQSVPLASGTLSSGTSGNLPASAFSFASPKQTGPSSSGTIFAGIPGNAPASAFSSTNQKQSGLIFKPSAQAQVPATESMKPLGGAQQLVKPTPTNQSQPGNPAVSSFQLPAMSTTATAKAQAQAQDVNLRGDRPKAISSVSSQVTEQNLLAQPKPTPPTSHHSTPIVAKQEETNTHSLGFKLPGQSTGNTFTRQEATKKTVPVSKGNEIEASVSENIQEAIIQFNEEMAKLLDNVRSMQRNCCLTDDNRDLASFKKTTDGIGRTLADIKNATKDQQKDIDDEKKKLFEAFEMLEDARIKQEKKSDPRYVQLLKSRGLDPLNKNKMRDIRNLHLYLDKALREVNVVLDEQWNKENEHKRSIQRPALGEVYQTLKVHHKIAQDQGAKLEQITQEMKNRKLLSTAWQRNSVNTTSLRDDLSTLGDPFSVSKQEFKSPIKSVSAPISPQKQAQLRSMFQKRRNTPVRRSMAVPRTVSKTPIVKPSRPDVPFFSSTPAIKPGDVAEGSKGTFGFGVPIAEQIEQSDGDDSLSEEGSQDEEPREELERWNTTHKAPPSGPGSSPTQSGPTSSSKGSFNLGSLKGDAELKKPAPLTVRMAAPADSSQAKSVPQPAVIGAFSTVARSGDAGIKPPELHATQAEPAKASSGVFLPTAKAQPSSAAVVTPKGDFVPAVKGISTETPPNIAAAMAAMNRASAAQGVVQSSSNLDPSASIEPVTLVTYKPQTQGGAQAKDYDTENNAAKAIANAALMAATAEAQKPSTKPQCSTEFIFKSTDSGKPGPPVVTFKPPTSPPQTSESGNKVTAAPNVTVNPTPVFTPAFAPAVPSSSTASTTGGLQQTQAPGPFSQLSSASSSFSFAPPAGTLFNLGSSTGTTSSTMSAFSFNSKAKGTVGDTKAPSQTAAASIVTPNAAKAGTPTSVPAAGIAPSPRVSRNLFAAGDASSQTAPTGGEQDGKQEDSKEPLKTVQVTTATPSIAGSSGISTPVTGTTGFSFSAPTPSGGGFFKNLNLSTASNAGNVFGTGDTGGNSTSILSALMRTSATGNTGNLFAALPTAVSKDVASTTSTLPSQVTKGIPSENKDTSASTLTTPSGVGLTTAAGGVFAQALSESSKFGMVPSTTTGITLPPTTSIFGVPATTTTSTSGGLFGQSSDGAKTGIAAPSTTTAASNLFGLSAGSASSAFSATSTASPFFPSISPASTNTAAPAGSSPLTTLPPPSSSAALTSVPEGSATSAASQGSVFGQVTSTTSAFGAVPNTASSAVGATSSTTTAGNLFGASAPTAFAPAPLFGTSSGSTFGGTQPFSSPVSSQGSTFGSAAVFGSTAGAGSAIGQSSFAPTTSTGFGTGSKPTENALGFGFGGFGLGGQSSSQANKANPFGVTQGFQAATTTQSSLFGGKSGADVFKMSDSTTKPGFGSGPFSQSTFGSQSPGGFAGGSFSAQGGSVVASGFGFGASSPSGTTGFGSPQPFGSPTAGGSVFGGAPSFGSAPAFGGAPAFGSSPQGSLGVNPSGGVFGGVSSSGFGQSAGSPSFGNLATQSNLPSFGAMAGMPGVQGFGGMQQPLQQQQQQQQQQQAPSGFGSFGGSPQSPSGASFSQWRR